MADKLNAQTRKKNKERSVKNCWGQKIWTLSLSSSISPKLTFSLAEESKSSAASILNASVLISPLTPLPKLLLKSPPSTNPYFQVSHSHATLMVFLLPSNLYHCSPVLPPPALSIDLLTETSALEKKPYFLTHFRCPLLFKFSSLLLNLISHCSCLLTPLYRHLKCHWFETK